MRVPEVHDSVQAFVNMTVQGRKVEVLRCGGSSQVMMFQLSRHVDAFDLSTEEGVVHTVKLGDIRAIHTGRRAECEFGVLLPELDRSCMVLELRDRRCLAIRFPNEDAVADFARCMFVFAVELRNGEASSD